MAWTAGRVIAPLLRKIADMIEKPPPMRDGFVRLNDKLYLRVPEATARGMQPTTVTHTPFTEDEDAQGTRQAAALALMDPDTYGFLLLMLKKDEHGPDAQIKPMGIILPEWQEAFNAAMASIVAHTV